MILLRDSCQVPASRILYAISQKLFKKSSKNWETIIFIFVNIMLGFIIERLPLAMHFERPSLAILLGRTSWVVTEHNL